AAQHTVKFTDTGLDARKGLTRHRRELDRLGRHPVRPNAPHRWCRTHRDRAFDQRVPRLALRAAALPFETLLSALPTHEHGPGLRSFSHGHTSRCSAH